MADERQPSNKSDDDDRGGLGELLIKVAVALGARESKLRWRLQRFRMRREKAARGRERRAQHVGYEHKKCPSCRAINDKGDKICANCGEALSWRVTQMVRRAGFGGLTSGAAILIGAFVAVYITVLGTQTGSLEIREWIVRWMAPEALGTAENLIGAPLLNPSLIGLLASALAVFLLGREIEELYGRFTMVALFMLTAVIGVAGHHAIWADKLSLGATPGIAGLIGIGLARGQRELRQGGRELRDLMIKWLICVAVLLLILVHDIVAEGIALAAGAAIGALIAPARVQSPAVKWPVGIAGVAAVAAGAYAAIASLAVF